MRSHKNYFLIIFTAIFMLLFTACEMEYNFASSNQLRRKDAKKFIIEKEVVEPIKKLDINARISDIELLPADDYYVEIDYMYWEDEPEYSIKDGVLSFIDKKSFPNSYTIDFNLHNNIRIYLPEDALLDYMTISTSNGDITASGFISKDLDFTLSYGDLTLEKATTSKADITLSCGKSAITDVSIGKLEYVNSYGNAEFKNINTADIKLPDNATYDYTHISMSCGNSNINSLISSSVDVTNSYGDIICKEVTADGAKMNLSCGDFKINNSDIKDIDISNSYGNANLSLTGSEKDYDLDLETSYGDIEVDGKSYDEHLQRDNKGTRVINATLSSGDVEVIFKQE